MKTHFPQNLLETTWTLTECRNDGAPGSVMQIEQKSFLIGRSPNATMTLSSQAVSKNHAEIVIEEGRPVVRDLESTNGTFVNGRPAEQVPLTDGDIVQFGNLMFRIGKVLTDEFGETVESNSLPWAAALLQFEELMSGIGFLPYFQPIAELSTGRVAGYELLARSKLEGLQNPYAMFTTAARLGQECNLSELMRREGVRDALQLKSCKNLFVNTHPKEIIKPRFLQSLKELRELAPRLPMTVEIHESAVTYGSEFLEFKEFLVEQEMKLAYDDFGSGMARLEELAEVPPDVLKFDIKLIHKIDRSPASRRRVVESLVTKVRQWGVLPLAEGVETAEEAAICAEIGFVLGQGYFYGRPEESPR